MRKYESGQALVLVLLSLSVVLTLILYILSRSVTDVAVSSRQEEAVRAFSAAEAGIERSLVTGASYTSPVGIGTNATYTTTVSDIAVGGPEIPFPDPISSGDTVTVWFVSHDQFGNLICDGTHPCFTGTAIEVCWGNPGTTPGATSPAIETSVYYDITPGGPWNIQVGRAAVDPYAASRGNSFDSSLDGGTCSIGDQSYAFHKTINFADINIPSGVYNTVNGLQLAQIKMLYNVTPHVIGVKVTGANLPSQGKQIDSSGIAGDSNRRVVVFQGWPEFPFASNTVISPNGIIK